jgi:hypothetical protein
MASKAIRKLVVLFGETYRQSVSEVTIEAYAAGLEGMTDEQVLVAGKRAIQSCKFMPTPSELRELAGQGNAANAIAAWADVQRAMPLGSYKSIDFADPLINAVVRLLGGWPALLDRCGTVDGVKWYRIEFTKLYESLSLSGVDGEVCRPLVGLAEVQALGGKVVRAIPVVVSADVARKALSAEKVRGRVESRPVEGKATARVEFKRA